MMKILLPFFVALLFTSPIYGQKTLQFRISNVYSDVDDMDGFGSGDSDPQWNYQINDNTFGISDGTNTEIGGTNCPGWRVLNDAFFSQEYDCDLPTSYSFVWAGLEDDAFGSDANTGNQVVNFTNGSVNPNQTSWTTINTYTATAGGDNCSGGGTVTWRVILQYRVLGSSLCQDECVNPYLLPLAQEFNCGSTQTTTPLSLHIYAREPADASESLNSTAGITCTIDGASPEDVWVRTTIPPNTGGVTIQFENHGECTGFLCQTNITYAWYTSSDGTCAGLEYRGCDAVSCFLGCGNGEIQVDGVAGEEVWVRIWEEDDQGHHIEINAITPTAPADNCYTALPLGATGCNYQATSPISGVYAEPDLPSWTSAAHPGGLCQDGDMNPLTNTIWTSNENLVWYTYTHPGGDFDLAIDNMICTGGATAAQIGVFSNSATPQDPTCDLSTEVGYGCSVGVGAIQLSITAMPAGNYIIVVDGNAGAECDWIFTDFIGNSPLPIELFNFEAQLINMDEVLVGWLTGSEKENDYFTVERSLDGDNWEEIETVQGAGNTSEVTKYSTIDSNPYLGISYYRLKQTDFDGKSSYSAVRAINNKMLSDINVYPNPASNLLTVEFEHDGNTEFYVVNSMGSEVNVMIEQKDNKALINVSELPQGVYFLTVKRDNFVQREKFVVEHN